MFWKRKKKIEPYRSISFKVPDEYILNLLELYDKHLANQTTISRYELFNYVKMILIEKFNEEFKEDIRYGIDTEHALCPKIIRQVKSD